MPVVSSNFLITGIRNYSIDWAKLFQKIRHNYMITSINNKITNPKTRGENTHAKVCTKATDRGPSSEKHRMADLWLDHVTGSSLLLTDTVVLQFYFIQFYINSESLYTVFTCATRTIWSLKFRQRAVKTRQYVARYNDRSFIKLTYRNIQLMARLNRIGYLWFS